jgi:glycosyltransferase involved in cell wall biosynthesis
MAKPKISVVLSVLNESEKLGKCLESVTWADEIILVDNGSTDGTRDIAKSYGAMLFPRKNNPMLNINKNFGFGKASGDWILCLDGDEVIPSPLKDEILSKIAAADSVSGYWIARKNIIFGKWIQHGLWWPDKQLRLFRRGSGKFPEKHVHEYIEVQGRTESLEEPFVHHNYEHVSQFLRKMDLLYTNSEVDKLESSQYRYVWYDALRFPVSDFVKIFFAQKAYRDGLHGLVLSLLQSFYSFIVFVKLWERNSFREADISLPDIGGELGKIRSEIWYWYASARIEESVPGPKRILFKVIRRIRRAFMI